MSTGGDSGHKGPAVSAQEAQMQAIMQQARVKTHTCTNTHYISHTYASLCKLIALCHYHIAGDEGSNRTHGFDRPSWSSGMSVYLFSVCRKDDICDIMMSLIWFHA